MYAQGYQAKDIRQFVQSFNMSRKFSDEQAGPSLGNFVEHFEGNQDKEDKELKRRTDWSEFMEDDEKDKNPAYLKSNSKEEGLFEPESPDGGMFKKPKLMGKYDSSCSSGLGDNKLYKPQFSRRNTNKATCNQQEVALTKEPTKTQSRFSRGPVCAEYPSNNNNLPRNVGRGWQQEQQKKTHIATMKKGASKWSAYMEEDEGDHFEGHRAAFADDFKLCHFDLETHVTDQRVEDDIHPDFI